MAKQIYDRDDVVTIELTGTNFPVGVRAEFSPHGSFSNVVTTRNSSTSVTVIAQYAELTADVGDVFALILKKGRFKFTYQRAIEIIAVPASTLEIGSISPQAVDANNVGIPFTVTGAGFDGTTVVSISGSNVTFVADPPEPPISSTQITGTLTAALAAATGLRNVTVTKGIEADTLAASLEVIPIVVPVDIVSITPNTLPQGTTRNYAIAGTDFASGCTVAFSGANVTVNSVTFNSSVSLSVNVTVGGAAATTQRNVTVTNPDTSTDTLTNGVTVTVDTSIHIDATWLTNNGPAPYFLNTEGATYVLDVDVTTSGTAFYVVKQNVTFDLNGYKISYNSAGSANKWGVCPYISYHNTEIPPVPGAQFPNGFACTNGTIECVVAGDSCHAIYDYTSTDMTYHDLELVSKGKDSYCIYGRWGSFTVEHCYLDCRSTTTFNRHQGPAAVFGLAALVTARYNCVVGGNSAFVCSHGSIIEKNIMRHSGFATNGYGGWFYQCDNINCSDNIIIPSNGRGILANAGVDHVYENNVILHLEAPNAEFGSALNPPAVRARYDTDNIVYQNNTSLGIGGTGLTSASSIYLSNDGVNPCSFTGNHGTVILTGTPDGEHYCQPITFENSGYTELAQDVVETNTFRSNLYMVRTDGYDGPSYQQRPLIDNTFEWVTGDTARTDFATALNDKLAALEPDFLAHRFVQAEALVAAAIAQIDSLITGVALQSSKAFWYSGYATTSSQEIHATVSDSTFGSGVNSETVAYAALREPPITLGVATQLAYQVLDGVTPVASADVAAVNNQGDAFTLRTDGSGWIIGGVPIVDYAMDKPAGVGQAFAKVFRTSTTLTVAGNPSSPWTITH